MNIYFIIVNQLFELYKFFNKNKMKKFKFLKICNRTKIKFFFFEKIIKFSFTLANLNCRNMMITYFNSREFLKRISAQGIESS